ncbi:CYTH and CHAD domain-containing protein [Ornithinimicrobium humiphilum]|uniref:CHAD domain-containing protein n=1 Tax=Ornithinimicrobium humiphilum TaxID=125288 RepID=A0A543KK48_9MICO|nr:CYTH and CHAD domain-containing protein [Ornithinimicrobium humiphilum]TQM95455.1 CHAD domain-containing protein [Ornithinimicrobium humiphilum]
MKQVETELKFALGRQDPLPSPGDLARTGPVRAHALRAVYLDTRDLLLVRHRITLRRREGGTDAGWHLKLPRPDGSRLEVHAPLVDGPGRTRVPAELVAELRSALGHAWPEGVLGVLLPVAVLRTVRLQLDLTDPEDPGHVLAEMCDDAVTALPGGESWRELEVELVDGDVAFLDAVAEVFARQGVRPATSPSKLARALGDRPERAARGEAPSPEGPAADVVHTYLAEQVAGILGREDDLRADAPDAVHKARVATRRLRSALRTFRRLLHRDVTDPLREEVRWFAGALGAPRDAEVVRDRILTALEAQDEVVGPVRERVRTSLDERHTRARAELVGVLDSERYRELADRLVELLAEPPWRGRAHRPADAVLPTQVARAVDRASATAALASASTGAEQLHQLHEARKRAKAVRYAYEALAPSFGARAAEAAARWERVTEELGQVQDSVVAEAELTSLARAAEEAGEPTFTYGVLVGRETATRSGERIAGGLHALAEALDADVPLG